MDEIDQVGAINTTAEAEPPVSPPSAAPPMYVLGVRSHKRFLLVPQAAIIYISIEGGLTTAYTEQGRFWTDLTLTQVAGRLDPRAFFRLSASHLINLCRVAELQPFTHQRYRVVFADPAKTELLVSRDVGRRLRAYVGW